MSEALRPTVGDLQRVESIPAKLVQIGSSSAVIVPAAIARLFGWAVGTRVRARVKEGGVVFETSLKPRNSSVYVIVPVDVLRAHGFQRGQEVEVPFHEWEVLDRVN